MPSSTATAAESTSQEAEVLFSAGVRRKEVLGLGLFDIDQSRKTVMVRLGKGKKDRLIPIGERALLWV